MERLYMMIYTAEKHILSLTLWASSYISTMHIRPLGSFEDPTCAVIGEQETSPNIYAMSSPLKPTLKCSVIIKFSFLNT